MPAKRNPKTVKIGNFLLSAVSKDRERAFTEVANELCFIIADTPDISHKYAGISLDDVAKLRDARNNKGLEAARSAVTPEMVKAYSFAGTVEDVIASVKEQVNAGVEHIIFSAPFSPDKPMDGVRTLGEEVVSQF